MNQSIYCSFLAACLLSGIANQVTGQERTDTIIKGQTIDIIQSYKPEIVRTQKPELQPSPLRIDTTKPRFNYEVPQQMLSYTYNSVPIRPLALGRQEHILPFHNYVKAGLGNRSSIYLDAGIGSLQADNYQTAFHLSHLSQKGPIVNQYSSRTAFDAQGKYFFQGHAVAAQLDIFRSGYSFYGYDHDTFEYAKDAIRQTFIGANAGISLENTTDNKYHITYRPALSFGMYSDRYQAREKSFGFELPASMQLDSVLSLHLGMKGNLTQLSTDSFNTGNNFFQVAAGVGIHLNKTEINVQVAPTWGKAGKFYFLPNLNLRSLMIDDKLTLIAGWDARLIQNTYQQLSTKNPFIHNLYPVLQTRTDQVYGGFETLLGQHFSFGATLSWRQWKNMALFVNDYTTTPDGKQFAIVYDTHVQAIGLDAFAQYQVGEVFSLHARGVWNNFIKKTTFDKVWHEPMLRLHIGLNAQPVRKLDIGVGADFMDGVYTQLADGSADKLPAFMDLSATAAYQIIPRVSVFTQLNNILGQQYQRWYQYPVYGFTIIGGIKLKF